MSTIELSESIWHQIPPSPLPKSQNDEDASGNGNDVGDAIHKDQGDVMDKEIDNADDGVEDCVDEDDDVGDDAPYDFSKTWKTWSNPLLSGETYQNHERNTPLFRKKSAPPILF